MFGKLEKRKVNGKLNTKKTNPNLFVQVKYRCADAGRSEAGVGALIHAMLCDKIQIKK